MAIFGLLLAALMGLSLGLLGGGGSILAVPILKYALGFGAKEAIASSLAVVGITSLFAAASHWREGRVRLCTGLVFGLVAMVGAYLGAEYLAPFLSHFFQLQDGTGRGPFKDTMLVEPHMGEATFDFMADNPGEWFFHCHIVYHMESGMARVLSYEGG